MTTLSLQQRLADSSVVTDTMIVFWHGEFSQHYPALFVLDSSLYDPNVVEMKCHNAEQYMMAEKALLFGDTGAYRAIMATSSPINIKSLGRLVKNFDEAKWIEERKKIVVRGNIAKFTQNESLLDLMVDTGDRQLVEGSPYDRIWGIGMKHTDPLALDPSKWKGMNLLGECLMEARLSVEK
jgi:ribA/ribD-fused uncharacterized protein